MSISIIQLAKVVKPGSQVALLVPRDGGGIQDIVIGRPAVAPPPQRQRIVIFGTPSAVCDRYLTTEQDSGHIIGSSGQSIEGK